MAVSLPDTFKFPENTIQGRILREAVLPACREFDLPLSLMIGVRYQVNPRIRLAGSGAVAGRAAAAGAGAAASPPARGATARPA